MKYSSVPFSEKLHNNGNNSRDRHINTGQLVPFLFTSLGVATVFSFFLLYSPFPSQFAPKQGFDSVQNKQHLDQDNDHNSVLPKPQPQHHQDHDQNIIQPKHQISKFQNNPVSYFL